MTDRILVCPDDEALLGALRGRALVVRVDDPARVAAAAACARRANALHAIWLEPGLPLAAVAPREDWRDVPLALRVTGLGELQVVARRLDALRAADVRVYLPAGDARSLVAARLLSSLQVATALDVDGARADWDAVGDLLHYAAFGIVPHAPIDPFDHVIEHFQPDGLTDCGRVYLDDPTRYLHVDREGRIALHPADLAAGRSVGGLEDEAGLEDHPAYLADREAWRDVFLEPGGCACCPAWRVCLGRFGPAPGADAGAATCRSVFTELMDAADHHRGLRDEVRRRWQP